MNSPLTFSFDIGYASIGWAVVQAALSSELDPKILGCGVVLFPSDDCLASKRREYRRLRRNIRSRRVRIERLAKLLIGVGIISEDESQLPGHPAPFYLASEALQGHRILSPVELWHVLRWYAHNRGYDNNALWSRNDTSLAEIKEDMDKVKNAVNLMKKHGTQTMATTICRELRLEADHTNAPMTVDTPAYKTLNTAFPRSIVHDEVHQILRQSATGIPQLTSDVINFIIQDESLQAGQREQLASWGIRLPKRFYGGLLFGQLIPRFDNRIINSCPITWAHVYEDSLQHGLTEEQAKHQADKLAKVPSAHSPEYYEYRMARVLNNLRIGSQPLPAKLRQQLMEEARTKGKLTASSLSKIVTSWAPDQETNIENYFTLHPDSEKALVLDPAVEVLQRTGLWETLSPGAQRIALNRLRRGKPCTPQYLLDQMRSYGESTEQLERLIEKESKKNKKKQTTPWGTTPLIPKNATGRAPYARPVLKQVVREVLAGYDPTRPAQSDQHPDGENKKQDGCLYCLLDPDSTVNLYQSKRPIDSLTNNHLVRHRMLIFTRLLRDLIQEYADNVPQNVAQLCIEVGRELTEFSGMTAKEIKADLGARLKNHKEATTFLEKNEIQVNANLIRKCRIAMDMDWTCPYTLQRYHAHELKHMELEHIVPYSHRPTNSLASLVLTWPEVNKMKGQRTALDFITQDENKAVPGKENLSICSKDAYLAFVDKLDVRKGHADDKKRKGKRKHLLRIQGIRNKKQTQEQLDMTEGMMTQSSHLMKLASRVARQLLPNVHIETIPGELTGHVRKCWDVLGCLSDFCPDIDPKNINKTILRENTHMHHALDACVLGLIPHLIPSSQNFQIRQALKLRHLGQEMAQQFRDFPLKRHYALKADQGLQLLDLPKPLKENIRSVLQEQRVIRHIPADMSGAMLEETLWRVLNVQGEGTNASVSIRSSSSTVQQGKRTRITKNDQCKANKLVGILPRKYSKLKSLKAVKVIAGNYGVALDPQPTIIRHVNVLTQILALKKQNNNQPIRIIRNGMLIRLTSNKNPARNGIWKIASIKDGQNGILFDLQHPHFIANNKKSPCKWREVLLKTLLKDYNLEILHTSYTGKIL